MVAVMKTIHKIMSRTFIRCINKYIPKQHYERVGLFNLEMEMHGFLARFITRCEKNTTSFRFRPGAISGVHKTATSERRGYLTCLFSCCLRNKFFARRGV
jgi:hypothetical protein